MKNGILILLAFISFVKIGNSQLHIDGKELRQETIQYIEIEFFSVVGSSDVKMFIDYGQNIGFLDRKNRIVSDAKGDALIFNSPVHGLNWLFTKGYQVKHVYNPTSGGTSVNNDLIYLIEKRKTE